MSYYKTIDGVKYDQSLLTHADALISGANDGRISFDDAKVIWDAALDGGKVSRVERRTLHHIAMTYNVTDKAKLWLAQHLFSIKGEQTYDKVLIDAADLAVEGKGDGRISEEDAALIWRMVESDGKVTDLERRTLTYILKRYNVTSSAKAFLEEKL